MARPNPASGIDVESMVGVLTQEGYVKLRWGEQSGQLTPKEARDFAHSVLEAAASAESDAVILRMLNEDGKPESLQFAAAIISKIREFRESRQGGS